MHEGVSVSLCVLPSSDCILALHMATNEFGLEWNASGVDNEATVSQNSANGCSSPWASPSAVIVVPLSLWKTRMETNSNVIATADSGRGRIKSMKMCLDK